MTDAAQLDIDDRVRHATFGTGTVVDLGAGKGAAVRIVVEFDNGIERRLPAGAFTRVNG